MYVLCASAMLACACGTKEKFPFMSTGSGTAVINLDEAMSAEQVGNALKEADGRGVTSYIIYGDAGKLGLSPVCNPFKDTKVEYIDMSGVSGWDEIESAGKLFPSGSFNANSYIPSFINLKKVILPDEIEVIGSFAFYRCRALLEVSGKNVRDIEAAAFQECGVLHTAVFPELEALKEQAFEKCTSLRDADFPKLSYMMNDAFAECTSLTQIYFPMVEKIPVFAFRKCTGLESVDLPSAAKIEQQAFESCHSLRYISLTAAGNIMIEGHAFEAGYPGFDTQSCMLVLNADKKPEGSGSPSADTGAGTWAGAKWKSISFE